MKWFFRIVGLLVLGYGFYLSVAIDLGGRSFAGHCYDVAASPMVQQKMQVIGLALKKRLGEPKELSLSQREHLEQDRQALERLLNSSP